ncbi:hypothetical protein [Zoogloea dura]|uniref:Uncharacterized protein n=1 Tax=Zoogloea dura TaxID=2728840 RepID=A0A848G679_9RHOO|nr:hypothetical protein [Zoogloea dura]NML26744.1 hypothetical protein [Zoogloea dura]
MALPWSTLVKAIPWSDVISKAPDLAQGARKLWQKASGQSGAGERQAEAATPLADTDARFASLDTRLVELATRQQEVTELLAALATQNAELVSTADTLRQQLRRLWVAVGLLTVLSVGSLILPFLTR